MALHTILALTYLDPSCPSLPKCEPVLPSPGPPVRGNPVHRFLNSNSHDAHKDPAFQVPPTPNPCQYRTNQQTSRSLAIYLALTVQIAAPSPPKSVLA